MTKFIGILISPEGDEFFEAYGPMTKDRSKATRFSEAAFASRAATCRFGRAGEGFWRSERESEAASLKEYTHWTSRVEQEGRGHIWQIDVPCDLVDTCASCGEVRA